MVFTVYFFYTYKAQHAQVNKVKGHIKVKSVLNGHVTSNGQDDKHSNYSIRYITDM